MRCPLAEVRLFSTVACWLVPDQGVRGPASAAAPSRGISTLASATASFTVADSFTGLRGVYEDRTSARLRSLVLGRGGTRRARMKISRPVLGCF